MEKSKNILICPLEWGLGHATRMIPLATELLTLNHNVIFASGKEHISLISKELPGCRY
ncbi:MAG: glycosyltransferase, partial [Bacteroidales bacterium]|nr:glycosyltransferase [Bacteroidales bacterium]